jgi:hypothetical protein
MQEIDTLFEDYVVPEPNSGCWLWDGAVDKNGYGKIKRDGVSLRAHRLVYACAIGPIPDGMLVCHTCDVPMCVNPAHLFIGTCADNQRDMRLKGKYRNNPKLRDHCPNGHRRTEENTYWFRNKRLCRDCRREADMARYERDGEKRRALARAIYNRRSEAL